MMKKLMITLVAVAGLYAAMSMTGCDSRQSAKPMEYNVTCTIDGRAPIDSATLLVLEEQYNKLRVCGTARATAGTFTFKGQIDAPKVALIRWEGDSTGPLHFVLEQGDIHITVKDGGWSVSGSPMNTEYQDFVNWRTGMMTARADIWQDYLKAAADKSLRHEDELRMVRQDSLLNDSLQRVTVLRINRGDAVGRIIRERFAGQLDQEHRDQLN